MTLPLDVERLRRSCASKKAYPSEKFAKEVAKKVLRERDTLLRVYGCDACGLWHLTAQVVA